jgi:hypothetical protein
VDWLIPHQANIRIIEATGKKLGVDRNRVIVTVTVMAILQQPRCRWRWMRRCATDESSTDRKFWSRASAVASPGALPCSNS